MRARAVVVAAVALAVVLVASQLAFTDVGREIATNWSRPATLDAVTAGPETHVTALAAAGGHGGAGSVAWVVQRGDRWQVRYAGATIRDGEVGVGDVRTLTSGDAELTDVAVASTADGALVVWERHDDNELVLANTATGERRVVSEGSLRVAEPSVTVVDGTPVVAWQAYRDGGYRVRLRAVGRGDATTVGESVAGDRSPRVTATGNYVGVVWIDPDGVAVRARTGRLTDDGVALGPSRTLGSARPTGGFGGGGGGSVTLAADSDATGVRAAWTDLGTVTTAGVPWDGAPGGTTAVGGGTRPGIAVDDGDWLAAWLVNSVASGTDVAYRTGDASGPVSRLASSANDPQPVYAPDAGIVWRERGEQSRVLVSAYTPGSERDAVARLAGSGGRFAFVGLAAALVGAATVPVMPWAFFGLLGSFLLTTRVVYGRVCRLLAFLASDGDAGPGDVERRLRALPVGVWIALFGVGETLLLLAFLPASVQATSLSFSNPVGVSLLAAAATVPVVYAADVDSAWRGAVVFAYFQTAALWTTGLPTVM